MNARRQRLLGWLVSILLFGSLASPAPGEVVSNSPMPAKSSDVMRAKTESGYVIRPATFDGSILTDDFVNQLALAEGETLLGWHYEGPGHIFVLVGDHSDYAAYSVIDRPCSPRALDRACFDGYVVVSSVVGTGGVDIVQEDLETIAVATEFFFETFSQIRRLSIAAMSKPRGEGWILVDTTLRCEDVDEWVSKEIYGVMEFMTLPSKVEWTSAYDVKIHAEVLGFDVASLFDLGVQGRFQELASSPITGIADLDSLLIFSGKILGREVEQVIDDDNLSSRCKELSTESPETGRGEKETSGA